jgi:pimeloyl-ACP methyl ester carboxylesterase
MYKRDGMQPEFWESMKRARLEDMPLELREAYLKAAPHPENLKSFHDKSVERMLDFKDWPARMIRGIQAPTLVINGDADVVRPEHALEMFRLLPHAQLAILPGTNHMALVERADWLASMIATFLDAPMP